MIQPLQIKETGAEGGHPQILFGGEIPTLEPSSAPTASPKEDKQHLVGGPPLAGTAGGLLAPTSRTFGKQGQVSESPCHHQPAGLHMAAPWRGGRGS